MSDELYERYKEALRRGHVAAMRGRLADAAAAYADAATLAPDRAIPHARLSAGLRRMARPAEALAASDAALERAPDNEHILDGRAEALADLGRSVEAANVLDRRAEVLDGAGRLVDACGAATRALELAESKPRRRVVEVFVRRLSELPADAATTAAIEAARRVLDPAAMQVEPEPAPAPPDAAELTHAADAALAAGDAVTALDRLLAAAAAHRATGREDAALDVCYRCLSIAPADTRIHLLLTELWLDRGWRGPAIEKAVLLERYADLAGDPATRDRLASIARDRLADEPRLASLTG
jgi:tetratricopeptide (TPR) repeat protein